MKFLFLYVQAPFIEITNTQTRQLPMKVCTRIFYSIVFLLGFTVSSLAQITLYVDDQEADLGDVITASVKVIDFNEILSAQFSVNWDTTILRFVEAQDFGIEDISLNEHFGLNNTKHGALSFAWYDETISGVTLPDSSVLFSIRLEVISEDSNVAVIISDIPTFIEIGNINGEILDVTTQSGTVTVKDEMTTSVQNLTEAVISMEQNFPNPFKDATFVPITFKQATPAVLSLYDTTGKILFQKKGNFPLGTYVWKISRSDLSAAGVYYYQVQTERQTLTKKLSIID